MLVTLIFATAFIEVYSVSRDMGFKLLASDCHVTSAPTTILSARSLIHCSAECLKTDDCYGIVYGPQTTHCELVNDPQILYSTIFPYFNGYSVYRSTLKYNIGSTQETQSECKADASVMLTDAFAVFSGLRVHLYHGWQDLTVGPFQSQDISSFLPGISGPVDAAYADAISNSLYVIQGQTVYTYTMDTMSQTNEKTLDEHFGSSIPLPANAVLVTPDRVDIISVDRVYEIKGENTREYDINSNGSLNPYGSHATAPAPITAATFVSESEFIFFSNDNIHIYNPLLLVGGKGTWSDEGYMMC